MSNVKKIFFATTNEGKLKEASDFLDIEIMGTPLDIPEIQSLDPIKVAEEKARAYFAVIKKPLFVEDVSLSFDAFGSLPGTYINDFSKVLGNGGLVKLIGKNGGATAQTTLAYVDEIGKTHIFTGIIKGEVAKEPRGDRGFGWDPIFIPEGETRTFGEMREQEKAQYSMRIKALKKLKKFLERA